MSDEKLEFSPGEQRERDVLLRHLLKTSPKSRPKRERGKKHSQVPTLKTKGRPASKGRVHKGKTRA